MTMTRQEKKARRDAVTFERQGVPDSFVGPMHRPRTFDPYQQFLWDFADHWMTAAEWLSWQRRTGRPYKVFGRMGRWTPQVRPQISRLSRLHWNMKNTRLPA